jgi:2-haloalkanoic acid dehalogenase type II
MIADGIHAICFDLDNTLWEIEPVLTRAEGILADWLRTRYPRMAEAYSAEAMQMLRDAVLAEAPHRAHDLTWLRRETLARMAAAAGYDPGIADDAFAAWHAARNQCVPFDDVVPALERLNARYRLATLSNGNADLGCIGIAAHFEISLHASSLGFAKPDMRAYEAVADALTLTPSRILFVGDDPHADVSGPRAAGMRTVWMNRTRAQWPREIAKADATVADLNGLAALLLET